MTCAVCGSALEGDAVVHPACVPAGLAREAAMAVLELIAVVATPVVIVWAG
jgi:hypothetical protein